MSALTRARRQAHAEQIWQKLTHIEQELESQIEKFDMETNSTMNDKSLQAFEHLLKDWKKYEDQFERCAF